MSSLKKPNHSDDNLMFPPPGFKFIPKGELICGKPGCFECFDIYCERCESKDRRIVELEMRNNDLVKYITQLQGKLFGTRNNPQVNDTSPMGMTSPTSPNNGSDPFAMIQSPVLYDPSLGVSYVATTTFNTAAKSGNLSPSPSFAPRTPAPRT